MIRLLHHIPLRYTLRLLLPFVLTLIFAAPLVYAQNENTFTLAAQNLKNDAEVELDALKWRYHAGDDARWADAQFDDSAWEVLDSTALRPDALPQSGWRGIGWFRLRLRVDPTLANKPLVFRVQHYGASEIYLDGKLVERFGTVGASAETERSFNPRNIPGGIVFDGSGEHVIAVRHSCMDMRDMTKGRGKWLAEQSFDSSAGSGRWVNGAGFTLRLYASNEEGVAAEKLQTNGIKIASLIAVFSTIGLLHLLLFWFYPRQRANLFFSLYAISLAFRSFCGLLLATRDYDVGTWVALSYIIWILVPPLSLSYLAFLYAAFHLRVPRYFWLILAAFYEVILYTLFFGDSRWQQSLLVAIQFIIGAEAVRITVSALMKKSDGARIVGIATLFYALGPLEAAVRIAGYTVPKAFLFFFTRFSFFGIVIAISVYLARNFARTSANLEAKLIEVETLSAKELEQARIASELSIEREQEKARFAIVEAENERRARELDEARQLQLSMLPKKLPQLPNLEIAAYMKPATEVGGDYYDFHVGDDGTLTIAVGDATGHGLKAGTMVTATKSLFNNLAHETDIEDIFKQSSAALKKMNLRGLFMAMTMAKIKGNQLTISSAGMPAALISRRELRRVEEISIKAMPLGSPLAAPFEQRELTLLVGDCVLLMSDGFPEMFNEQGEILGYEKARGILEQAAHQSPQEIINRFVEAAEVWAQGRPQDDDVTFVVLKVKDKDGQLTRN